MLCYVLDRTVLSAVLCVGLKVSVHCYVLVLSTLLRVVVGFGNPAVNWLQGFLYPLCVGFEWLAM